MAKVYNERWEVLENLSSGGQSQIYIVHDIKDEGHITENKILKRLINKNRIDRFKREIESLNAINSPYIMQVIDFDTDGEPYYVTNYYGPTLESKIEEYKDNLVGTLQFLIKVCEGLERCHMGNLVHRDLKPDNILVKSDGSPVIIDFGLCFIQNGDRITLADEQVGSRFYIPPECEGGRGEDVGPQSDVYCLGKVLYAMLTGGKKFPREKHREDLNNLELIYDKNPRMAYINRILDKCITENIQLRYKNASFLKYDLMEHLRLIDDKYYPIKRGSDLCRFCGEGTYVLCGKMANWEISRKDKRMIISGNELERFPIEFWRCPKCGNVQFFANWEVENLK